jgi:hypothetical protein
MRKKKSAEPMVAASDDGRQEYALAEGVTVVNSRKVAGRTVRLTLAEALFDLSLGRILPMVQADDTSDEAADGRD